MSAVLALALLLSYGAFWTRGLQGDDFCMGYDAYSHSYWGAVRYWLEHHNGRLFLALLQTGMYSLADFSDPVLGPWYLYQGLILLAYLGAAVLLTRLLLDVGMASGPAFVGVIPFAIHPVVSEVPMWLAAGYGYITGALLLLVAVWSYFRYEHGGHPLWALVAGVAAVAATSGVEQFLPVLAGLVLLQTLYSRYAGGGRHTWLPWLILSISLMEFASFHFILFQGTGAKLARSAGEGLGALQLARQIGWWLNPLPVSSPYGSRFAAGFDLLSAAWLPAAACVVSVLAAAWLTGRRGSWTWSEDSATGGEERRCLWLGLVGVVLLLAPVVPFFFTGRYGLRPRNMFVPLMGTAVLVASLLSWLARWVSPRQVFSGLLRWALAGGVALFVGASLVANIGAQRFYFEASELHADVMLAIDRDRAEILRAGGLMLEGVPPPPYDSIAHMDTGWDFACLVHWMLRDGRVAAWTNLTPVTDVPPFEGQPHRIRWSEGASRR